jgi:small subunit ribosomal protein SAe
MSAAGSQIPPVLTLREEDVKRMIACGVHLGNQNMDTSMARYVFKRNENGVHIIDIRKTWEKLQLAARAIVCVENPKDVCVVALSSQNSIPYAQRAVLKLGQYIGCRTIAGRFTPGTFTNQQQSHFFEPRLLIASDTIKDHQPIVEASYVNMPVIAFVNTNSSLRGVDIAIPCNTSGKNSIALMYYMLAREVLRLQNAVSRDKDWEVMVDMFVYRDPEEAEKQQARAAEGEGTQGEATGTTQGEGTQADWNASSNAGAEESTAGGQNWGDDQTGDGW